jgi:putative chitinase
MQFKKGQISKIAGCSQATEDKWFDAINAACDKFAINTKLRLAAFIAQILHESGRLSATTENLNYSAPGLQKTWPKRFDSTTASQCAKNPEKIANKVYSGRLGNGDESSGDGFKYRGRGLIQCTGKSNYDAFSQACGVDAVNNPDSVAEPANAALSAGWFWNSKGLNAYADSKDFLTITKRVNGGTNGQADRQALYDKALIVLSDEDTTPTKTDPSTPPKKPAEVVPDKTSDVTVAKTPPAQNSSIIEPRAAVGGTTSKYPWNLVYESRSGHVTEIDDTPGEERLNMTHRMGTYWEIDKNGTLTLKSILDSYILTKGDAYNYVGGNYTQQVTGQTYSHSSGDMIFKSDANTFFTTSKVQMNTGMLAVSGEVNAPNINANVFGPLGSGLAFGDMLSKEAIVAYDVKHGGSPVLSNSLGFTSSNGSGSADSMLTNGLSKKSPSGKPWITNGVSASDSLIPVIAATAAVAAFLGNSDTDTPSAKAMTSVASDADTAATASSNDTPVFLKHVSFDKPLLTSQSDTLSLPDPTLYVNNLHTIVSPDGVGKLFQSDGREWRPVGDPKLANDYTDSVTSKARLDLGNDIVSEAINRTLALQNEASQRSQAIVSEAIARQSAIAQGILAEATARGAAIIAESTIRQSAEQSLSDHIITLTASTATNIAAAVQQEQQARTDAVSAEALARQVLAAKVDNNIASITTEQTVRANADIAISSSLTQYIASNNVAVATNKTDINNKVDAQGNALASQINTVAAATLSNAHIDAVALVSSEATTRTNSENAIATRIDTVFAQTASNLALISTETTARVNADGALGTRLDSVSAKTDSNLALINTETTARTNGDSALASQITVLSATAAGKAKVTKSNSAPSSPSIGDFWVNTSTGANQLQIWNGSSWEDSDYRWTRNAADIVTEQNARASGDSANASLITTVTSRVNGHDNSIASVTSTASTNATNIGNVKAQYAIKTNVNGYVSGIALISDLIAGNPTSSFTVMADKFSVISPSANSGAPFSPFTVDTINNTILLSGSVRINGATIKNGTITPSALSVDNLSAISANIGNITSGDIYSTTLHGGSGYPTNAYSWPNNGGDGFHLSSSGLLVGNVNTGKYFQLDSSGNLYAPKFSIINGNATFSGDLSAVNGTFSGTLTADQVITTGNLKNNSVTSSGMGYSADPGAPASVYAPAFVSVGGPVFISVSMKFNRGGSYADACLPTAHIYRDITNSNLPLAFCYSDTPGAGTHQYHVLVDGGGQNLGWTPQNIVIYTVELKR